MKKLIVAALAFTATVAYAHGDAEWIMKDPKYVTKNGVHCCGPTDCEVAKPGEVVRIPGGWRHVPTDTVLMDGEVGVYGSIDAQIWRCVLNGQLKCVFISSGV